VVPKWLIVFDPGATTGWAVFRRGKLVACGYSSLKKLWDAPVWKYVKKGTLVVVEVPMFYGSHKEKNPQSILRNGVLSGEIKGMCRARGATVEELSPARKWKGTIPKPGPGETYIIEPLVLQASTPKELVLIKQTKSARATGLNHNMIDAVGLGRWRLRKEI
jgi:hypothetical protein